MVRSRRRSRGSTIVEALVAFLVLSFGAIAMLRLQTDLRFAAETARQRAEAVRIAEDDLETLRAFAALTAASGALGSFADVIDSDRRIAASAVSAGSPVYVLERRVRPVGAAPVREVTVAVRWQDVRGDAQRVDLASMIAASDPALAGALALMPTGAPAPAASAPAP